MATCWPFCSASRQLERRVAAGRDQRSHLDRADLFDDRGRRTAMLGRRYRTAASSPWATAASAGSSQLPRWLTKISAGLPSSRSCANSSWVRSSISMRLSSGRAAIVLPDMVEMREFGADAAEIVPDACQNGLDLLGRFFRKGGGQIGAADPLFAQSSDR